MAKNNLFTKPTVILLPQQKSSFTSKINSLFQVPPTMKGKFQKKLIAELKFPKNFRDFEKSRKDKSSYFRKSQFFKEKIMKFITVIKFKIKSPNILLKESYKPM